MRARLRFWLFTAARAPFPRQRRAQTAARTTSSSANARAVMAGEVRAIAPIDHSAYETLIEARRKAPR